MARLLSQTLARRCVPSTLSPRPLTHLHRSKSNRSGSSDGQLYEVDIDSSSSSSSSSTSSDVEFVHDGVKKLEEVIHTIIVRRSAPDWLPFLPGYSYWVPPRHPHAHSIFEVFGKVAAASEHPSPFSGDGKTTSLTSSRGWPSASFFIQGRAPAHPMSIEMVEVKLKIQEDDSEDEEG